MLKEYILKCASYIQYISLVSYAYTAHINKHTHTHTHTHKYICIVIEATQQLFIISADCLQFSLSVLAETRSNFEFMVIKMRLVNDRLLSVWKYREKSELHNYIDNHKLHCMGGSIIGSILRRFEGPPRYNSQAEEIHLPFNPYASRFTSLFSPFLSQFLL